MLSAFPAEIGPLLDAAEVDATSDVDGHRFYLGTLGGGDVVLGLTGIGLVNAEATATAALDTFGCITAVVFSGVAGGERIGDVVVPEEWTEDGSTTIAVDGSMLEAAAAVAPGVELAGQTPAGDPACVCDDPAPVRHVSVPHDPAVQVGGLGQSTDPFGGRHFPCTPGGGDVFGCDPCGDLRPRPPDAAGMAAFADPGFFTGFFENPPQIDPRYAAQDMETARVGAVASARGVPFIAFRGVSDGGGDPLHLPGFPFQFFAYRQLAADNAAAVTVAFLEHWGA